MGAKIFRFTYLKVIKPVVFLFDSESMHNLMTYVGWMLGFFSITRFITKVMFRYDNPKLSQEILGIKFENPIGLSAGFDKDANLTKIMYGVGFGFMQVGSVTLNPYQGNPTPRLIRLPKSKGAIVNFGLKNIGVYKIIDKLKNQKQKRFPICISIAKTNSSMASTTDGGILDYLGSLKRLNDGQIGDFYTINISCPNTFGGEPYTTPAKLDKLLRKLVAVRVGKPMFVKMPINLEWGTFKKLLDIIVRYKIDGVIIGNLNKDYSSNLVKDEIAKGTKGGISGRPCRELSNHLIYKTYEKYSNKLKIIGVGGVFSAKDAYEKIQLGASLVQLITGMIYQGPQLIGEINHDIVELLAADGYENISDAIGTHHNH